MAPAHNELTLKRTGAYGLSLYYNDDLIAGPVTIVAVGDRSQIEIAIPLEAVRIEGDPSQPDPEEARG